MVRLFDIRWLIAAAWRIYASVNKVIIDPDNGLSHDRRQAIILANVEILLIGPLEIYLGKIFIEIQTCSFKKMHLKISLTKWQPFYLGLNVLNYW